MRASGEPDFPQIPTDPMTETTTPPQVGQIVPDFTMPAYEPTTNTFGEFSLKANMDAGKWTILFFYPADFTFV